MERFDPREFAVSLSAKLATRSRHVCAFFGAGIARACDLPDVAMLQEGVVASLDGEDQEQLARLLEGRNLEQVLTCLRRITALISGEDSEQVFGLTADRAAKLDLLICKAIVQALSVEGADLLPVRDVASWLARANYHMPVEVFTINYDLLLETALESLGVPYFDGFVGTLRARFDTELVEATPTLEMAGLPARFVRLWKLHGSVNWVRNDDNEIVRIGNAVTAQLAAAIYPSDTKYEESRRVPYVVLQDRFRRALQQPETLMLIAGYSFGDAHLNDLLFDAATRCERSEYVVFCHSNIPAEVADRATRTPNLQVLGEREAIRGGLAGEWRQQLAPLPNLWDDGRFVLGDFRNLAAYLARSSTEGPRPIGQPEARVKEVAGAEQPEDTNHG